MISPGIDTYSGDGQLGHYYRAHEPGTDVLLAGMTLVPAENGSRSIDILLANPGSADAAVRAMLTRELFKEFSGVGRRESATYVSISEQLAGQDEGIRSAFDDFAFADDGRLVIPMPGTVLTRGGQSGKGQGEDRGPLDESFTGIFSYSPDGAANVSIEEFYRRGRYAGKIVTVEEDEFIYSPSVVAADAEDRPVAIEDGAHGTPMRIRFLKTLAENDPELADLIVAG